MDKYFSLLFKNLLCLEQCTLSTVDRKYLRLAPASAEADDEDGASDNSEIESETA